MMVSVTDRMKLKRLKEQRNLLDIQIEKLDPDDAKEDSDFSMLLPREAYPENMARFSFDKDGKDNEKELLSQILNVYQLEDEVLNADRFYRRVKRLIDKEAEDKLMREYAKEIGSDSIAGLHCCDNFIDWKKAREEQATSDKEQDYYQCYDCGGYTDKVWEHWTFSDDRILFVGTCKECGYRLGYIFKPHSTITPPDKPQFHIITKEDVERYEKLKNMDLSKFSNEVIPYDDGWCECGRCRRDRKFERRLGSDV